MANMGRNLVFPALLFLASNWCGVKSEPITISAEWALVNFAARFCLTAPSPIHGPWTILLRFNQPISSIQIWDAKYQESSEDQLEMLLTSEPWSPTWEVANQQRCVNFEGVKARTDLGSVIGSARFINLQRECQRVDSGQEFEVETKRWSQGLKVEFCLTVPMDMVDWRIALKFDEEMDRLEVWEAEAESDDNTSWVLSPKEWDRNLTEGERFCLGFLAFTQQHMTPCIDAYFTYKESESTQSPDSNNQSD